MRRGAHKVNPVGFRIGVNKNWSSRWYAHKKDYAKFIIEDLKLRKFVMQKVKNAGFSSMVIRRMQNKISLEVYLSRPGVIIGRSGAGIQQIKESIEKEFNTTIELKTFEVKHPEVDARLIAESVAAQCERRISPLKAAQKAVEIARDSGIVKGVEVWVGGRIKGANMSTRVKDAWGKVPRHTLRADIDYAFTEARVPSAGKHGIKVWIYKGEKPTYQID